MSEELEIPEVPRRPGRILVTNDDGIDAPGIRHLAAALTALTDDVLVVAPSDDLSGTGTGIGRYDPDLGVGLRPVSLDVDVEAYAIDGPPGLAVMAASLGAFGPAPGLVMSGINAGINTGHSVVHSGTVGGALTAATFGGRGVAVSLDVDDVDEPPWGTAAHVAVAVAAWMLGEPDIRVLNVNVPARSVDGLRGACWAPLDAFGYFHLASADVPGRALSLEVGDRSSGLDPACDTARCRDGYVTLTALGTIEPVSTPDVPAGSVALPDDGDLAGSGQR